MAPAVLLSGGVTGVYPPEPPSFPRLGKGRGIGLNITEISLMNFTNSPYERIMKEVPHYEKSAPQKAPEGSPCAGCSYWRGLPAFSATGSASKSRADMLAFGRKRRPVCRGSDHGLGGGNMISLSTLDFPKCC